MNDCFRLLMKDNERKHRQKEKAALENPSKLNQLKNKLGNQIVSLLLLTSSLFF